MSHKVSKVGTLPPFNTAKFNRAISDKSILARPDLATRKTLKTQPLAILDATRLNPAIFGPTASVGPKTISKKMHRTGELAVFNKAHLNPAVFGEPGVLDSKLVSKYAIDCALNQGVATGVRIMAEELVKLRMTEVSAADRSGSKYLGLAPNTVGARRPRPYPILIKHPSEQGQHVLLAGGELVDAAENSGATELECMVIPYATAIVVGRMFIDGFVLPRHGQVTLVQTTPPAVPPKQNVPGHDKTEQPLEKDDVPPAEIGDGRPAISQMKVKPALIPVGHQLQAQAIHDARVVDGEVVVRAHASSATPAAKAMLEKARGQGIDIIIEHSPLMTGRSGMSLYELSLCMFIRHLFYRVKDTASGNTTHQAGYTLFQEKKGTNWPGMPADLKEWVDGHWAFWLCRNSFWTAAIPDALFRACAALRYNVEEASSTQLDTYLYDLIKVAFKALELAKRQTSNLRKLNRINDSPKDRPAKADWREIINTSVDGIRDQQVGEVYQIEAFDLLMLAVLGRVNGAKIRHDEGERTLEYQWLVAIGDFVRTGKMIVTCLMAQEFVLVEIDRVAGRALDAGWLVFETALSIACKDRCSLEDARRELRLICEEAMVNSCGMIVSHSRDGRSNLVGAPLDEATSTAAEVPNLLF